MLNSSSAELTRPLAVPDDLGQPVWTERRSFPVYAVVGVPAVFLLVATVAVHQFAVRAILAAAGVALVVVSFRRRAKAVIETYTLTDRYMAVEQPGGGKVAVPVASLTRVVLNGGRVRLEGEAVRRPRAMHRRYRRIH